MNQLGFREATRSGLSFATDDLITPRSEGPRSSRDAEKEVAPQEQALPTRHHHRGRALQPGARRLDARPRADHHGDDGRAGDRLPHRPGYVNPIFLMAHSGARGGVEQMRQLGRHARSDGQAVRQDHRDADQGQLPRRPDGARVLQLDARCPQGSGRHGPQDGRLRLPDPQAGRRGAERRHHDGRLRHDAGHHQGRSSTAAKRSKSAWPTRFAAASAARTSSTRSPTK